MKRSTSIRIIAACVAIAISSCADLASNEKTKPVAKPDANSVAHLGQEWEVKSVQHGKASWYSIKTNYGTQTASGERLQNNAYTAAHKTLPMGTRVRVTNLANGKSEIVRITDRGPYIKGRIIDVTIGSAQRLGFYTRGVVPVKVEVLKRKENAVASQ